MTTFIIILAALGTLVFLMKEYGWSDLTGNTRNDLVFEERHKTYGAYEIRQKYSNRLIIAFFGVIAFISIAAVSPKVFLKNDGTNGNTPEKGNDKGFIVENFENKVKEKEPEKLPENKPKTNEAAPKAPDVSTVAQTTPKASDKPVENDTTQVNKNAIVSTTNHIGTDTSSTAQVIPGKGGKGNCSDCDTSTTVIDIKKKVHESGEVDRLASLENYQSFIRKHLRIPEGAKGGKVYMSFVVDAEGNVTQAKVKKGVDPLLDAEVKRVVSIMPRWTPAIKNGEQVAVRMVLPVNIVLN